MALLAALLTACAAPFEREGQYARMPSAAADVVPHYAPGDTVAVLLPERGYFAAAARAVRDGLLAAQAASDPSKRLTLRFYDSSNSADALNILQRAAADGATLAIGPLQREAVGLLADAPGLPMTTLAINDTEGRGLPPDALYRFALSPEDEAAAAARAARDKGYRSALIIYPDGTWGTRIAKAFTSHWQALGGAIEAGQMYDAETLTPDSPLERLFQTAQFATSANGLGTEADFIFLVGTARASQVLVPQIRALSGDRLPVFTTSHIYAADFAALRDQGLVGIYFVDIPWMLPALRDERGDKGLDRSARSPNVDYQRMFAMGVDAYRLAPMIAAGPSRSEPILDGQTGVLRVDRNRRIRRQLILMRVEPWGLSVQR